MIEAEIPPISEDRHPQPDGRGVVVGRRPEEAAGLDTGATAGGPSKDFTPEATLVTKKGIPQI
jgi:hypothetical protein